MECFNEIFENKIGLKLNKRKIIMKKKIQKRGMKEEE